MTDTQEIDARRALAVSHHMFECKLDDDATNRGCIGLGESCRCLEAARAIRKSDEAAGYILIKHEGIISSEGMKPVEGE